MTDARKKQPLSLNQRHYRFLVDLSATQPRHKTEPGEVNVEEPVSKLKESSPRLFAGIADFDSPSSTLDMLKASETHESSKAIEEDGGSSGTNPTTSDSCEYRTYPPGEERQTKVRIEGRRRLCKVSQKDSDAGAGNNFINDEEPKFDGISDFDSPLQVNKPYESNGNEIRDILNDLSSRLEILSIEKKRVPKKVDLMEDFQESVRSKLYDVTINEGYPEYQAAASSNLLPSDSPVEIIESKVGRMFTNEHKKEKTCNADIKDDSYVGKANRTMHKYEGHTNNDLMTAHVKLGSAKESQAYSHRREEEKYVALSERYSVKQVGRRQEKFIEVSDEESDDVTILGDDVDDIKLSGLKCTYKLPGKIAKMLYPHQRDGLKWLWSLHCKGKGGILGDDMGLGKTMQMCSFIAGLFHSNLIRRVLVVAPKTLLTHWINELSTVGLSEKTREFKEKYEHFINRGNEKNASDREKRTGSSVAKDLRDCIQPYFLRRLKSEVFRDDSTLSKKNEIIVWLRLTRCQRQLYEAFLKSEIVLSACDGSPLAALTILKKICDHPLLLTKRAAEEVLEGMDSIVDQEDHRVAEKLAMHMADVAERFDIADLVPKGHNVLIFSQTRKMLNLIQESLLSNHYKYMRIDGTTKVTDRAKLVKDFQEGRGAPIFLLTSQVGGLGLTLTNADRVIVVDPAWNPRYSKEDYSEVQLNIKNRSVISANRAHYAFNPKDIKKVQKNSSPDVKEPSEYEIRERINRLSHIFSNKVAVSRLPDKGEKIHKQISALYLQLDQLRMAKANKNDVIEL
ncbi:hypothetical protein DH2020_025757 [Rehmannia glutinosa]|uniref:Helicase C-terminal domain-containing protein n=1 Tax=Rehmannia glutinosa TaxID=99300 RepID=A0ABR0W2N6_REHGL